VVAALASWVLVLRTAIWVEVGPPAYLFKNPKNDYTRALLAAAINLETGPESVVAQ
jgi:microcin C transport system ATP-binding protein